MIPGLTFVVLVFVFVGTLISEAPLLTFVVLILVIVEFVIFVVPGLALHSINICCC